MNLSTLKSLQSRIREATGADRELDIAIWDALDPTETIGPPGPRIESSIAPPYTTDPDGLGACVALMRSQFPDANWERVQRQMGICGIRNGPQWSHWVKPLANDCLTFLDAICAALIAEEEAKQKDAVE